VSLTGQTLKIKIKKMMCNRFSLWNCWKHYSYRILIDSELVGNVSVSYCLTFSYVLILSDAVLWSSYFKRDYAEISLF
jgi:hypothetical protein